VLRTEEVRALTAAMRRVDPDPSEQALEDRQRRVPHDRGHHFPGHSPWCHDRLVSDVPHPKEGPPEPPEDERDESQGVGGESPLWVRWTAGLGIAVALAVVAALYYRTDVCDEHLTSTGKVVEVCRHLQATDPPVAALALLALVALTAFFTEITGFGISLKRQVRANTRRTNAALSKAAIAQETSNVAQEVALQSATAGQAPRSMTPADRVERAELLCEEYNAIREEEGSSRSRSVRLTRVVSKMLGELAGVDPETFPLREHLADTENGGRRVAGYSFIYANPDVSLAPAAVQAVLNESTRFGQYWAIRALARIVQADPHSLDFNSRRALEHYLAGLGANTDRAHELRELLAAAQSK
jgi:hypothetical protein